MPQAFEENCPYFEEGKMKIFMRVDPNSSQMMMMMNTNDAILTYKVLKCNVAGCFNSCKRK